MLILGIGRPSRIFGDGVDVELGVVRLDIRFVVDLDHHVGEVEHQVLGGVQIVKATALPFHADMSIAALSAVVECTHYSHDISVTRRAV